MPPTRWTKSDPGMVVQQPAFLVSRMPALVPEFELAIVRIGGVSRTELTCDKRSELWLSEAGLYREARAVDDSLIIFMFTITMLWAVQLEPARDEDKRKVLPDTVNVG